MKRRSFLKLITGTASAIGAGMSGIANAFDGMGFENLARQKLQKPVSTEPFKYVGGKPSQPYTGDVFLDPSTKLCMIYDGSKWIKM